MKCSVEGLVVWFGQSMKGTRVRYFGQHVDCTEEASRDAQLLAPRHLAYGIRFQLGQDGKRKKDKKKEGFPALAQDCIIAQVQWRPFFVGQHPRERSPPL